MTGHFIEYLKFISSTVQHYQVIYLIIFMEGMFCGKYPFHDYIASKLNAVSSLIILLITFVFRALIIRAPSDCLFDIIFVIPFVISVAKLLCYSLFAKKVFGYLGKYSSYMWYSHAYFYSYLFFDLVFRCDLSFFVYAQVVIYSLAVSILFELVEKRLFSSH